MVGAAGTSFFDRSDNVLFPAHMQEVIAVRGINADGSPCDWCHYGWQVEYGVLVPAAGPDMDYPGLVSTGGSSTAAAMISGLIALILEEHPTWSASQVESRLDDAATSYVGGTGLFGIDALRAVCSLDQPKSPVLLSPSNTGSVFSTTVQLEWTVENEGDCFTYQVKVDTEAGFTSPYIYHLQIDHKDLTLTASDGFQYGETYYWKIRSYNEVGNSTWSPIRSFTINEMESSIFGFNMVEFKTWATYNATVAGANQENYDDLNYEWYIKQPNETGWNSTGITTRTFDLYMTYSPGVEIKVEISNGSQSDQAQIYVENCGFNCGP